MKKSNYKQKFPTQNIEKPPSIVSNFITGISVGTGSAIAHKTIDYITNTHKKIDSCDLYYEKMKNCIDKENTMFNCQEIFENLKKCKENC